LYGMLHLRTAVAAARHQDRSTAHGLLAHAERAADQLGVDANYWQTGFGPSNVELHRIATALDLGDITQVIDSAPRVNVKHLPVERQVTHLIDLARALSLVAKDDDALQTLLGSGAPRIGGLSEHRVIRAQPRGGGKHSSPVPSSGRLFGLTHETQGQKGAHVTGAPRHDSTGN